MDAMIDPVALEAQVESAISPYENLVSAEVLEQMRVVLRLTLLHHPGASALTQAVVPHKEIGASADVPKDGVEGKLAERASGDDE